MDTRDHVAKVEKLLALAASRCNEHEWSLASKKLLAYLDAHPLPIRWYAPEGTVIAIVPVDVLAARGDLRSRLRTSALRVGNWFPERSRVRVEAEAERVAVSGYLQFQRYGYALFVPMKALQVRL